MSEPIPYPPGYNPDDPRWSRPDAIGSPGPAHIEGTKRLPDPFKPVFDTRGPPTAEAAEAAVLEAVLMDPEHAAETLSGLSTRDFVSGERNTETAAAIFRLLEAGQLPDGPAVKASGGWPEFMFGILPHQASLPSAKRVVREFTVRRGVRDAIVRAEITVHDPTLTAAQVLAGVEQDLQALAPQAGDVTILSAPEGAQRACMLMESYTQGGDATGLQTGLVDLDRKVGGFRPGEVVVLAARPGEGKTTLAMQIARHTASRGHPVLVCSYETTAEQLYENALCAVADVPTHIVRAGRASPADWDALVRAAEAIHAMALHICDSPTAEMPDIRRAAHRVSQTAPLALLVVDYIQLVPSDRPDRNREQEVAAVSRGLKLLAKEFRCVVLALSQLNRLSEQGQREPRLSDLRESGAIEQDADTVIFLWRPSENRGEVEAKIAKQRHGPIGKTTLTFLRDRLKFADYARHEEPALTERIAP